MNLGKARQLEAAVRALTNPIAGQYPRPWVTDSKDPASSRVFVVGYNQAKTFPVAEVGSHDQFIDALFNRGLESCRDLYRRVAGEPSPTRVVTDSLVRALASQGVSDVLQTNVVCYSTPRAADVRDAIHAEGLSAGTELFASLVQIVQPKVIITHGAETWKMLTKTLRLRPELAEAPKSMSAPLFHEHDGIRIYPLKSFSGAPFNSWRSWAFAYFDAVSKDVASFLSRTSV